MSKPPPTVFDTKTWKAAKKSGRRFVAIASNRQVRGPTPEDQEYLRKQALADKEELRNLLLRLLGTYDRKSIIKAVRDLTAPAPRGRGRRKSPWAARETIQLIEAVEGRRAAGSRRPLRDIYEALFLDERQSPRHYENWRKEFQKKRRKLAKQSRGA
jgi:hypothetical protein